ncbi:MAG: FAD-dependent oxidoreductase [Sphingomonadaceae bacterium]|nr:FAD-dependent oxidoreductase [Sphingomonadaceae bacterium]
MPISRADAAKRVAIVGAGISGLSCAAELQAAGYDVTLFDKGRGPGGRMSSRRFSTPLGEAVADHGAQYFTARDPAFLTQVQEWESAGIVAPWPDISEDAWVGVPTMNQIVRHMAATLNVHWNMRITTASQTHNGWTLSGEDQQVDGHYDMLVLAIPSEQAVTLLAQHDFGMAREAMLARFQPCWNIDTGESFPELEPKHFSFNSPRGWCPACRGHGRIFPWMLEPKDDDEKDDSAARLREFGIDAAEDVADALLMALAKELHLPPLQPIAHSTHRWRFAMSTGLGTGSLWNSHIGLGVCGDWLLGPRIECGWLSGRHLSGKILVEELVAVAD